MPEKLSKAEKEYLWCDVGWNVGNKLVVASMRVHYAPLWEKFLYNIFGTGPLVDKHRELKRLQEESDNIFRKCILE